MLGSAMIDSTPSQGENSDPFHARGFPPPSRFRGWWAEGTPGEEYEDGVFNIYAVTALDAYANYTAVIDRSSSLKSSCGHPVSCRFLPEVIGLRLRIRDFFRVNVGHSSANPTCLLLSDHKS